MQEIRIDEYDYDLPADRIAQYPLPGRDSSRLLVYNGTGISSDSFRNIGSHIPPGSHLVFNNTRVISARLLFRKGSGALVEVLCLEPLSPHSYELSFSSVDPVEWKCMIGNLKKWKSGKLSMQFTTGGEAYSLMAERIGQEGEAWRVRFSWSNPRLSFSEVIEASGHTPLPPYINREDETEDRLRYQTVYSRIRGSVAAPTAGLHFTDELLHSLSENGIGTSNITLHVGAGTFQPVRTSDIADHTMHCERFSVTDETIENLLANHGKIIAVGTTSVRTLESLYWLGVKIIADSSRQNDFSAISQWEPYGEDRGFSVEESLEALRSRLADKNIIELEASTSMIIVPGYRFRMIEGMITNFHQPRSTLLLLVSAWTGNDWKKIYSYALGNGFRFLSYGDSSLLINH
ncbi:MAG: S-adenosylmethionine:tRNA ribosyltransferase-isomerase [Bacteroidales bacterium]|jgi:S-adenosylmethionine:tRNA ribosyltransferase-isomerase|nr:S-adenosylmethionine:tRNA ribosyltransferase-isomerase [Bacteroidales bacterium]